MATRDRKDISGMTRRTSDTSSTPSRESYSSSSNYGLDPFSQFRRLADQMDRWFDTVGVGRTLNRMSGTHEQGAGLSSNLWAPELETFLRDDQFVIRMDLPGLSKDEVNVEVTDDSIVIHGERQKVHEEDRDGYYRSERSYGRFYREVPLPEGAQSDTAKASYRDGVLEICMTAPPRQVTRPRRIDINSSSPMERRERDKMPGSAATSTSSVSSTSMPITDRTSASSSSSSSSTERQSPSPGADRTSTSTSQSGRSVAHDKKP